MDLTAPVKIVDEMEDGVLESAGKLNLASGELTIDEFPGGACPALRKDYECTYGILNAQGKEVEFGIETEGGCYSVSADELSELKSKLAKLLAAPQAEAKKPKKGAKSKG